MGMLNAFVVKRKCLSCDCDYDCDLKHKYSTDINDYVKHIGCCKEECFNKEPKRKRNKLMFGAFIQNLRGRYK
jgi:hypothetical protein